MKKFILIFSLILSVIMTAGTGCPVLAANTGELGSDSVSNVEEKQISQQENTVRIDVQSLIQETEQMQSDINDIQAKLSRYNYVIGALVILLIAVCVFLFLMNKNMGTQLKKTANSDGEGRRRIDDELDAMSEKISNQRVIIENLSSEIGYLKSQPTTAISTSIKEPQTVTPTKKKPEKVVTPVETAKKIVKIKKYAMFSQDATGNMSILGRSLSDSSDGAWFEIEFADGSDSATYTINNSCKGEILADLSMLKRFVQELTVTGKPKDIKVQKVGTLVKDGSSWKIDNKLQIQLI